MNSRFPKGLIHVNIPQSRDERLIEKKRFDPPLLRVQRALEMLEGECVAEGLGSQLADHLFGRFAQRHASEFAGIVKANALSVGKLQNDSIVLIYRTF